MQIFFLVGMFNPHSHMLKVSELYCQLDVFKVCKVSIDTPVTFLQVFCLGWTWWRWIHCGVELATACSPRSALRWTCCSAVLDVSVREIIHQISPCLSLDAALDCLTAVIDIYTPQTRGPRTEPSGTKFNVHGGVNINMDKLRSVPLIPMKLSDICVSF